ncbi:MAG: hypothetical protein Q9166_005698 [cf. Caloplaca sp. 2 TL-2023]
MGLLCHGQVVFCLAYFGAYIGVQSNVPIGDLTSYPEEGSGVVSRDIADEIARVKDSTSGLRVLHMSKSFAKNRAVDDVSFKTSPGEVFALLGPNGAGKSTAISLIRGDIPPSKPHQASILMDSASVLTHRAAARAYFGVCPQSETSDTLTVTESLHFYARVRGVADPAHYIEEVITAFGLEPYRHRLAQKLSGGTKRKLSTAIAMIGNHSVLLLGEPNSGLDAGAKRVMWNALSAVSPGRAIVLTTHCMKEADGLAHRAGIMSMRMLMVGTVEGLRRRLGGGGCVLCASCYGKCAVYE